MPSSQEEIKAAWQLILFLFCSPEVEFCGYSVPHPSENKIHLRIQTRGMQSYPFIQDCFYIFLVCFFLGDDGIF